MTLFATDAPAPALVDELRRIPEFDDLQEHELRWLAEKGEVRALASGEVLFRAGEPASHLFALLDGEVHALPRGAPDSRVFIARAGEVSGKLPFSRMTRWAATGRAVLPTRVFLLHEDCFAAMLRAIPVLEQRLVTLMVDRVRYTTRTAEQWDRLMALGKLSAGLAHELNNPAAAARRSAHRLREMLDGLRDATLQFVDSDEAREAIESLLGARDSARSMDSLARSEREEALALRLEEKGVDRAWDIAGSLADAGLEADDLAACVLPPAAFTWLGAHLSAETLLREIEEASARVSALVNAVKSYSHMDGGTARVPTDVHAGLDSTLTMLGHRIRQCNVTVVREYAPDLPPVHGHPGELNQVWTHLLDNAIDAVERDTGRVTVRTGLRDTHVLVEIQDNGRGIPEELQARVWEPFFSTKPVGEGTGLGLDVVHTIVTQGHGGIIDLDSVPGDTRVTVLLPIRPPVAFGVLGMDASGNAAEVPLDVHPDVGAGRAGSGTGE
ncbi:MAG TPA: ATP-binding protein [Longimicrobium sp.]